MDDVLDGLANVLDALAITDVLTSRLFYPVTGIMILLMVLFLMYWGGVYSYGVLKNTNIPGPTPLPYIGNLREVSKHGGLHLAMAALMKKYGKVFTLCIGRNPTVVIGDPEMLKQIMVKDFHLFRNRFTLVKATNEWKFGLIPSRDDTWKRIRSTLTPTFTSGKLRQMTPLVEKSCDTLVEKMADIADTGKSVDILSWFSQMSLEVILSTSFGVQADVQANPDHQFINKSKAIFQSPRIVGFLLVLPFYRVAVRLFMRISNNVGYFIDLAKEIIHKRQQNAEHEGRKDLVNIMLSSKHPDGSRKLSDDEIVAQSVTFLLAGHETSSNTLASSAYYLALNQDIQDRLREEIRAALDSKPDTPAIELANELEYLDCVLNEVLRIRPPAHVTNRECSQRYTINGFTIPAGVEVSIPFYALHHDPDAWPEPDKFDPERFRGPAKDSRHPFQFLPFGNGPRNCIGMRFALMLVKLTLVKILSKYKFVRSPETQVPLVSIAGFTLVPCDGIHLHVETA